MPKRVFALLFLLMLLVGGRAHAGDIPESIMDGRHMAMLIGQITGIGSDTMTIEPHTVMMGDAGSGPVTVKRFDSYSIYPHNPRKGDYIVALLLDDQTIDESWVFQCSSADYKTLEIVHCNDVDMVKRYQQYINEGAYFEAQKRLGSRTRDPNATPSPIPTLGVETAEPSMTELLATGGQAAAQNQTAKTGATQPEGAAASAVPERAASGGAARPEQGDPATLVVTIVLAVLAVGGGLVMLSNEVARKKAKKNSGAQDRSQPSP